MLKISTKVELDEVCGYYGFLPQHTADAGPMAYAGSTLLIYVLVGDEKHTAAVYKFPGTGLSEAKKFVNGEYPQDKANEILEAIDDQLIKWDPEETIDFAEPEVAAPKTMPKEAVPDPVDAEPIHTVDSVIHKNVKVKLINADTLMQPVYATSSNSKYHVVGLGTRYNVAARWKGSSLSVRVEPKSLNDAKFYDIENPGLSKGTCDDGRTYYSTHVDCNDEVTYRKVLGALMGSMAGLTSYTLNGAVLKGEGV